MPPQNKPTARTKAPTARAWHLNLRGLIYLAVLLVVGAGAIAGSWYLQASRGRTTLLKQAEALAKTKQKDDLALSFLKEFLASDPNEKDRLKALDLRGELLARSARTPDQLAEIVKNGELLLRLDPSVKEVRGQAVRRRLVETYLALGPMLPPTERKYGTAQELARELATQTGSAADVRLHALTLERLGATGDRTNLPKAAARYEEARKLEPGDVAGSDRLARLYQFDLKEPAKADAVIADLLAANSKPSIKPPAYLAAAKFYTDRATDAVANGRAPLAPDDRKRAEDLIKKAVEADPKDLLVRLAAADLAITNKRPAEAAAHLQKVPEKDRKDFRYRTLEGIVALYENKAADAIESWSSGLKIAGGGDAELSWRLAFVLLQLGRVEEAEPLIGQFRRNVGLSADGEIPPGALFLDGLKFLKSNQPREAIKTLEKAGLKMPPGLKPQFHYTLGQAAEAVRDEARAMDEYRQASLADPKLAAPRLARARLLSRSKPEEMAAELRRGLAEAGEDIGLLMALARIEIDNQRRLPREKRSTAAIDALLERGRKVAPGAPALAVVNADKLVLMGNPEAAVDALSKATAIDKTDPELWIAHARRLVELGRVDQALTALEQAMAPGAAGDQASLRILRARILMSRGHAAEAREGLVRDLDRVRPDQRPSLWMALGDLYTSQNNTASARKALLEWAKLLPDDPLPRLFVLELSLADPSASADAEAVAKECMDALDKTGGVYGLIGQAAYKLRDRSGGKESAADRSRRLAEAEADIAKVEAQAPDLRFGHLLRGTLMEQRNEPKKAAEAYEKALKTDGGLSVLPRLVRIYGNLGKAGEADLARLRQAYPNVAATIARAGAENAVRAGNKEQAEELARQVVDGAGESLDARVWQARILNSLGKAEEAEKGLRDLIDKHPEDLAPRLALMYFQVSRREQAAAIKTVEEMIAKVKNVERRELVWAQAWRVVGERERADSAFEAALSLWPDDPRVGRAAAEYFTATGRAPKAREVLEAALKRDESQRWAARGLALILSSRPGDSASWKKAWDLVKDAAPGGDLPEDRLVRALVLSRGSDPAHRAEAVKVLKTLVDDLPGDLPAAVSARNLLANLLLPNDPAQAAEFASADAMVPGAGPAALTLHTRALIAANKFEDADRQLGRLAQIAPDDAATVTLRARLLRARGQGSQAAEALEKSAAEKIAGPDGEAIGRLIVQTLVTELKQPEAAERVARKLMEKYPKSGTVLAAVIASQGRREEALKLYLDAIKQGDPANAREAARNSLALITRDKYDPATISLADQVINSARLKDPESSDLMAMAGYLRHFQGRYEEEVQIYEKARASQPDDFNLANNMAWTLSEGLNKPEQALEQINNAINRSVFVPPHFYDTRGVILTRLGKYDDAIRDLEMSARERPTGPVWAHLARAYHKAGKLDKFREARDKARNSDPPLTLEMLEPSDRAELGPLILKD